MRMQYFLLVDGVLFKRSYARSLLWCLGPQEAEAILQEIHEGCCGNHLGGRALARKAALVEYFWPTMTRDAAWMVKACRSCQVHSHRSKHPVESMRASGVSCPFDQWGMDIVGPLSLATGQRKFLFVAIDYFSKWVEAEPLASITQHAVMQSLWKNILCRYEIPKWLVSDNGRQFQGHRILEWCRNLQVERAFTSVANSQTNGQVEVTN